jgi:cadmium resistance transport/sequestration family protein
VNEILLAIVEGVTAFVATNVDDFIILLLFFAQVDMTFRPRHVVSGSYWGFAILVALSLVGFFGGLVVSSTWIGVLGVLPIFLGIKQLIQPEQDHVQVANVTQDVSTSSKRHPVIAAFMQLLHPQAYKVAAVTVANGGDNLGIYIPLFAVSNAMVLGVILVIFFLLKGVWCYAAYRLTQTPKIAEVLTQYAHSIVPLLLIGLGVFILWKNGTSKLVVF